MTHVRPPPPKKTTRQILEDAAQLATATVDEQVPSLSSRPVSLDGWRALDRVETQAGALVGKPREKLLSLDEMLAVAAAARSGPSVGGGN